MMVRFFVTRSGSRGEELPVTLFRIDINGEVAEYSGDIANPTGIAFGKDGDNVCFQSAWMARFTK
jgi:hypothetical protein